MEVVGFWGARPKRNWGVLVFFGGAIFKKGRAPFTWKSPWCDSNNPRKVTLGSGIEGMRKVFIL